MKPTEKQKQFIEKMASVINDNFDTWVNTNDIESASHYTLIGESVDLCLGFELTDKQETALKEAIDNLYDVVKSIK